MSQAIEELIAKFKMPRPAVGGVVVYYRRGELDGESEPAVVDQVHTDGVSLRVMGSTEYIQCCRHIEDPSLEVRKELKEFGAWDFTDDFKFMKDLETRVDALESAITKPSNSTTKK